MKGDTNMLRRFLAVFTAALALAVPAAAQTRLNVAIAYHPSKVANPPRTFDELAAWVKANPGRFGYNGIKGGVSGVGFTMGWVYWKTGLYQQLTQGPVDKGKDGAIREAITALRDFNKR